MLLDFHDLQGLNGSSRKFRMILPVTMVWAQRLLPYPGPTPHFWGGFQKNTPHSCKHGARVTTGNPRMDEKNIQPEKTVQRIIQHRPGFPVTVVSIRKPIAIKFNIRLYIDICNQHIYTHLPGLKFSVEKKHYTFQEAVMTVEGRCSSVN